LTVSSEIAVSIVALNFRGEEFTSIPLVSLSPPTQVAVQPLSGNVVLSPVPIAGCLTPPVQTVIPPSAANEFEHHDSFVNLPSIFTNQWSLAKQIPPEGLISERYMRSSDPNVRGLPGVQVIDLDDLERECPLDVTTRRTEIERAEALAAEEAERIVEWVRLRAVGPAIVELRGYAEDIRVAEIRRSSARLKGLTPEQGAAVEALTAGIVNKLLHGPTVALRDAASRPGGLRRSQSRIVRVLRPDRGRAA